MCVCVCVCAGIIERTLFKNVCLCVHVLCYIICVWIDFVEFDLKKKSCLSDFASFVFLLTLSLSFLFCFLFVCLFCFPFPICIKALKSNFDIFFIKRGNESAPVERERTRSSCTGQ